MTFWSCVIKHDGMTVSHYFNIACYLTCSLKKLKPPKNSTLSKSTTPESCSLASNWSNYCKYRHLSCAIHASNTNPKNPNVSSSVSDQKMSRVRSMMNSDMDLHDSKASYEKTSRRSAVMESSEFLTYPIEKIIYAVSKMLASGHSRNDPVKIREMLVL